jgi:hypothetical protein
MPAGDAGIGLDALLVGSPNESPDVWLQTRPSNDRIDVTWPPGTVAVFDGDAFRVRLRDGNMFHRSGDRITGGCGEGRSGVVALIPGM